MSAIKIKSASDQVADHLREELRRGTWSGTMPGESQLLARLGVGRDTVKAALRQLEREGLLVSQGERSRRRIVLPEAVKSPTLKIGILCYDENDRASRVPIQLLHSLMEQGHAAFFASKTLEGLGMNVPRISSFVKRTAADAWIVNAGSRDVLEWFVEQEIPVFALYGAQVGLSVAGTGPNHELALRAAVRRLVQFGHHRIVSLCKRGRHDAGLGYTERIFANELEAHGLGCSSYNIPSWENDQAGFRRCLESLFEHTPPSALMIEEPTYFFATLQFCGDHQLRVPQDVTLICEERDASFDFANPSVSHFNWGYRSMVRRAVRWADNMSRGKEDKRQSRVIAKFVEGGTIGPAPPDRS